MLCYQMMVTEMQMSLKQGIVKNPMCNVQTCITSVMKHQGSCDKALYHHESIAAFPIYISITAYCLTDCKLLNVTGYKLLEDDKTCVDIDECSESPWLCTQTCENTAGSFHCKCANGYLKEPDGKTCRQNSGIQPYLLFSNRFVNDDCLITQINVGLVYEMEYDIID